MKCVLVALTISYGVMMPAAALAQQEPHTPGAVFVMTNAAVKNEIIAYARAADGTLQESQRVATGGRGSGGATDPLGSQGSLLLSQDASLLFAVNAGSGDASPAPAASPPSRARRRNIGAGLRRCLRACRACAA